MQAEAHGRPITYRTNTVQVIEFFGIEFDADSSNIEVSESDVSDMRVDGFDADEHYAKIEVEIATEDPYEASGLMWDIVKHLLSLGIAALPLTNHPAGVALLVMRSESHTAKAAIEYQINYTTKKVEVMS